MISGTSGVSVEFDRETVLRDVDFTVPAGSVVAVVGGDGAGKSTLLRCLVGRILPSAGEVRHPDRRLIGYMSTRSGTWRQLTVGENIDFVGGAFSMSRSDLDRRRTDLLERAKLTDAVDRLAGDLSGGMRQKLGFVLAMLHDPELLVLDEPSTGVDPVSRVELWRLIAEAAAAGTAVAMATSYLDEAERAHNVTVLDGGRVIAAGTRDEVMVSFPGCITAPDRAMEPAASWRRGSRLREWNGEETSIAATGARPLRLDELDFEDVVIASLLHDRSSASDDQESISP